MIEIRKGTKEDMDAFLALLAHVSGTMEHKEWFYLDTPEEFREMMDGGLMKLWAAMDGNQMVGAFDALIPGYEDFNYGYDLNLPRQELLRVINMDTAAVHPNYRGMGLQRRLMQTAEKELTDGSGKILLCTVHPENKYSLNNVLSQGYEIQATMPMYGSIRHILRKDVR